MSKYTLGDLTVHHWNDWDRVARDPMTVGLMITQGVGYSTAAALAAVGTWGFGTFAIGLIAVTAVTSWAISALTPKPDFSSLRGLLANTRDATSPQEVVYGEVRKGGVVTFMESTGDKNKFLHQIICLAGHEVNDIGDIYINDEIANPDNTTHLVGGDWNDKIYIRKFLGTSTQNVYGTLSGITDGPEWKDGTSGQAGDAGDFKGQGIACLYVRLEYDQDVFAEGIPIFTAKVQGKKVLDPRTSTTAYSNNPALCIRDYLTSNYGLSDTGDINDTMFNAAANTCDESVTLAGSGTQTRYEMNGAFVLSKTPADILADMMTSCAGTLFWGQGEWQLKVGEYTTPVKTFTLDDFRSGINLTTKHSRRDNFNIVRGTFIDADQDWVRADYPEIRSTSFISDDNGLENAIDLTLPFTTNSVMAQRLAKMTLFRSREQMTISADFGMEAFEVQVGDIVEITNERYGWTQKDFEVVGWKFSNSSDSGEMLINMTLRETSSAAFDWNAEESDITGNDSDLTDPSGGLAITNLVGTGGGRTTSDGTFINSVILTWDTPDNSFVSHYEIDWKPTADSNYSSTTSPDNSIELSPLVDGVEYTIRVRAVTTSGRRGAYTTITFTGGGDVTAPSLPTGISATGGFKYITIEWTNPADSDLNYVEVYENTTNSTTGATKVGISAGDSFTRTNLGLSQTRYYFLKSVDYTGNKSAFTSGVSAQTTYLDDADFENGVRQLFIDQELDIIEPVNSLPSAGDFNGQTVFLTTDGKLYTWNSTSYQWVAVVADVAANSITSTEILDGSISTPKLAANAVTAAKIQGGTITANEIQAYTITGGLLATSGIITSAAQINNAVIENAKIKDLAVERAKIGNNAANEVITFENTDYNVPTGSTAWNQFQDSFNTYDDSNTGAYFTESFTLDHEGNASTVADVIVVCSIHTAGVSTGDEILYRGLQIGGNSTSISSPFDEEEWRTTGRTILANATFVAAHSFSNAYDGTTLRAKMGATVKYMDANNSGQHGFNFKGFIWIRYR